MTLDEIIAELEKAHSPDWIVSIGFTNPHSYRGDYYELAFSVCYTPTVADMLADCKSALGATYEAWKGEDCTMSGSSDCYLVDVEGHTGEGIGLVLISYMLGKDLTTHE